MTDAERIAHLRGLEAHLGRHIIAQDHVLPRVAAAFARGELGVTAQHRPRSSFLLVGPTGSGKTETFTCAVNYTFGSGQLTVFDMSEYQDKTAVIKLLGADRDDPGLLGRALLARPRGGLLFDEIEKAYPLVLDLFLQILWDGRVTLATGQTVNFGDYYVGFASNIGGAEAMRMAQSKFASVEQAVLRRVTQNMRPEFVARIDEILVFALLSPNAQREICGLIVTAETIRLQGLGYDLQVSREALEFLVREGFHPQLGARPLRKTVERQLQDAVVRELFRCGGAGGEVVVDPGGRRLVVAPR
jgi:ATP-dependent Clp protease ATP-binding subunit ClpA